MLSKMTRAGRVRAGRLLALVYMLCVLAPSLAFAVSDGSLVAPCLTENEHGLGIVHVHDESVAHSHADGHAHHHAGSASHGKGEHLLAATASDDPGPMDHHHKSGGSCCGLFCITALPAVVVDLSKPSSLASRCATETYRRLADDPLPTPYRPPNS